MRVDIPGTRFDDEVVIRRVRFTSEDGGFAVIDAETAQDRDEIVLIGPLGHLEEREHVRITGVWQDDKRFGPQIKVKLAQPIPPSGEEALLAYLKRVRHVGGVRAAKLLDKYGVLSPRETQSRHDIYLEQYVKSVFTEARLVVEISRTMIFPAAVRYQNELATTCTNLKVLGYTFDTDTLD